MLISLRLFAFQAHIAGRQLALDLPDTATVADAIVALKLLHPAIPWAPGTLAAVNMEYVPPTHPLHPGDTLAIIPPVSGG